MKRDILLAVLAIALGFFIGFSCRHKSPTIEPETTVDTLVIRDTITSYEPVYVRVTTVDTMTVYVPVHDTVCRTDSVFVQLPRVSLEWADSLATVWISGYRPAVDSVRHYTATQVITGTERTPAPKWAIGIQGGVGATPDGLRPYIGVGIQYNLFPLTR